MSVPDSAPRPAAAQGQSLVAPPAPGRLGVPVDPVQTQRYLAALTEWVNTRRRELDLLDAAILRSEHRQQLTRDMMLSMALWKAVSDRLDLLLATWDSGRVGQTERERLSSLIWGRLDATLDPSLLARAAPERADDSVSGLGLSLPEACRLSDALVGQLRTRLALDPNAGQLTARVRDLRAQLERIRDQIALEPAALRAAPTAKLDGLARRADDMQARLSRGADVGGMIGPAEIEAATFERDLIVGGVERRQAHSLVHKARDLRADLESREAALQQLVAQCVRQVSPAPKYAVPDVDALGALPNTKAAIEAYLGRLDQVSRAMQVVQDAYSAALGQRDALVHRMDATRVHLDGFGLSERGDLSTLETLARDLLGREPTPIPVATELVEAYEAYVRWLIAQASGNRTPNRGEASS